MCLLFIYDYHGVIHRHVPCDSLSVHSNGSILRDVFYLVSFRVQLQQRMIASTHIICCSLAVPRLGDLYQSDLSAEHQGIVYKCECDALCFSKISVWMKCSNHQKRRRISKEKFL